VDVADQFQEIRIFFADDRFVSVLEKVATPLVSFVEGDGISGHQPSHDLAERGLAYSQEEMEMVWDQGPAVALGLGFIEDVCKTLQEGGAVLVVAEELSSFYSPGHNVLQQAGGV